MAASHDACPKCGGTKRKKNKQCAACRGYGRKRHVMPSGYVRVYVPGHPVAHTDGYALEHRYVLHEAGVVVPRGWHIHHIDGQRANNALDNLAVVRAGGHVRLHHLKTPFVTNQHGVFPVLFDEQERIERQRAHGRLSQRRIRARRRAEREASA